MLRTLKPITPDQLDTIYDEIAKDTEKSGRKTVKNHDYQCAVAKGIGVVERQGRRKNQEDAFGYKKLDPRTNLLSTEQLKTISRQSIKDTNQEIEKEDKESFSCHNSNIIRKKPDGTLEIINTHLGDSRSYLVHISEDYKKITINRLSKDHKPTDKEEHDRIRKAGGVVAPPMDRPNDYHRVNGVLAYSRALGGFNFNNKNDSNHPQKIQSEAKFISDEPTITTRIVPKTGISFLIMICDGVVEEENNLPHNPPKPILSDTDIAQIVFDNQDRPAETITQTIVDTAYNRGSNDNLTCCVVKLNEIDNETTDEDDFISFIVEIDDGSNGYKAAHCARKQHPIILERNIAAAEITHEETATRSSTTSHSQTPSSKIKISSRVDGTSSTKRKEEDNNENLQELFVTHAENRLIEFYRERAPEKYRAQHDLFLRNGRTKEFVESILSESDDKKSSLDDSTKNTMLRLAINCAYPNEFESRRIINKANQIFDKEINSHAKELFEMIRDIVAQGNQAPLETIFGKYLGMGNPIANMNSKDNDLQNVISSLLPLLTLCNSVGHKLFIATENKEKMYADLQEHYPKLFTLVKKCHVYAEGRFILSRYWQPEIIVTDRDRELIDEKKGKKGESATECLENFRVHCNKNLPLLKENRGALVKAMEAVLKTTILIVAVSIQMLTGCAERKITNIIHSGLATFLPKPNSQKALEKAMKPLPQTNDQAPKALFDPD